MSFCFRLVSFCLLIISFAVTAADTGTLIQSSIIKSTPKFPGSTLAVGVTLDQNGRLWLAQVANKHLQISRSEDDGKHFSTPVIVTSEAENIAANGENRPKIRVARNGTILVTWTQLLSEKYSGNIKFSRSIDSGRTFSRPVVLNDDGRIISHRFDSLATNREGRVVVAWLDARDRDAAREKGEAFKGISLYSSQSFDNGEHFEPNRQIHQHTCECCQTALTWTDSGPVMLLRNIFDGSTRDFALVNLDKAEEGVRRVTRDEWRIDACPHNGGSIAVDHKGQLHLTWFTDGAVNKGLFYKQINGDQESIPMRLGNLDAQPNHAAVVAHGATILLTWREFDGNLYSTQMMFSNDSGNTWQGPLDLMQSAGASDYPIPLINHNKALVVWHTENEGLRVLPIEAVINRLDG